MGGHLISFVGDVSAAGVADPLAVSNANPLPVALSGGIGGLSVAGTVADSAAVGANFINVEVFTDQAGTLNLFGEVSGGAFRLVSSVAVAANTFASIRVPTGYQFWQVTLVNGPVAQTLLALAVTGNSA
jgi:hypothetical protein